MDVKEASILGDTIRDHWYYVSKGRALRALVKNLDAHDVIDVGAGSAVFSRQLLAAGVCRRATCVDVAYEEEFAETVGDRTLSFVKEAGDERADLALMMDVLEHVDDDVSLLCHYAAHVKPGGHIVISVPAFQFLWSGHDVFLEHRRRYTMGSIERVVDAAGLKVERSRYFFSLLFPVAALMRLFSKASAENAQSALRPSGYLMNKCLTVVHDIERALIFPFNKLFGLTVFCVVRVPRQRGA